ncbi:MAG TPA: hypothetical protein VGQ81_02310 [Acidobacteriota bacterium]|jgi:hypothetical protein|nr:hypothetical protein [Acidobacteriota bacterium]
MIKLFAISFALASILIAFTIVTFCGQMFRCGCTLASGLTYCNIHQAALHSCPWCSRGKTEFTLWMLGIFGGTAITILAALQRIGPRLWIGMAAGLAGYLFWGSVFGLATALIDRYPVFFGFRI